MHLTRHLFILSIAVTLLVTSIAIAGDSSEAMKLCVMEQGERQYDTKSMKLDFTAGNRDHYSGSIRVYVVEPISRFYNTSDFEHFSFGFIDFALRMPFELAPGESFDTTVIWDGVVEGYGDVASDNIMALAAVFNNVPHPSYSDPPEDNYPYNAYYCDASAAAGPGEIGYDLVSEDFTHSVFIDAMEFSWCPYCEVDSLFKLKMTSEIPFHFVAIIPDVDSTAHNFAVQQYNLWGTPTLFVDGGYSTNLGLFSTGMLQTFIEAAGQRPVANLRLSVETEWIEESSIEVSLSIDNWRCGDADLSGNVDIDDVVYLIAYIFGGGPAPNPIASGDANCSGGVDIDDVVYLISYIFQGGNSPCDSNGDGLPDC